MKATTFHYCLKFFDIFPPIGRYLSWRGRFVAKHIAACGQNLKLASRVNIYNPKHLCCGDHVYIGYNTYIGGGMVRLDDEVVIGPFCCIVAGNHTCKDGSYRFGPYDAGSIEIGRGTWLGAHVTITNNVKIGKGCLIAAGAVVTHDVPDGVVVGGVPAKIIKNIDHSK